MTEREKNRIVEKELFGENKFDDRVIDNLYIDWDKAFTSIFYTKKSYELEKQGENVYKQIRENCEKFLEGFKEQLLNIAKH